MQNQSSQDNAEQTILNMLLGTQEYSGKIFNRVKADHFTNDDYKHIFLITKSIFLKQEEHQLPAGRENEFYHFINELKHCYISGANWEYYANFLEKEYEKRIIETARLKAENIESLDELSKLYEDAREKLAKEEFNAIEINDELFMSISDDYFNGFDALQTGYSPLDDIINGFYPGEYITLAGATGMGKTAMGLNLLLNFAKHGKKVMFISLEMSKISLVNRLICAESGIRGDKLRARKLDKSELELYGLVFEKNLQPLPFVIVDKSRMTMEDIRLQALKRQKERGLDVLIIDYLGLIAHKNSNISSYQKVCDITRELKILAKELNIPVICMAQINRATKDRNDKHPLLSDLRDSGSIEQDSDIVIFCHRDEYYNRISTTKKGIIEVIVAKHRNGQPNIAELLFDKPTQKITSKLSAGL